MQRQWKVSPDPAHKGMEVGMGYDQRWVQPSNDDCAKAKRQDYQFSFSPGPEFSFELLPEARAIRVTIAPGPEVSVRLCHQWALECEELSSPFEAQVWSVVSL